MDEDLLPEINDKHPQVPTYHRRAMEDHYPGGGVGVRREVKYSLYVYVLLLMLRF